jgi:hypothetical protein
MRVAACVWLCVLLRVCGCSVCSDQAMNIFTEGDNILQVLNRDKGVSRDTPTPTPTPPPLSVTLSGQTTDLSNG